MMQAPNSFLILNCFAQKIFSLKLTCAVLEYENGLAGLSKIEGTSTLVACLADNETTVEEMGMMRRKVTTVAECLKESV